MGTDLYQLYQAANRAIRQS